MTLLTLWTLLSIPVGVIVGLWLRACWEGLVNDMATLQRLGQEFDRPRAAIGSFPYPGHRTVAEIDAMASPFAAPGEHGRADPLSSAPVTFDDRVHGV